MRGIPLSLTDASLLLAESRVMPNHVGGLLVFRLPDDAPQGFMRRLMADFRGHRKFHAPWNRRLKQGLVERLRALADAARATLDDVVLALCAGALRRLLGERDALPA